MPSYVCITQPGPTYAPYVNVIASITQAKTPTVITTFDHGYPDGTVVRFQIPPALGMQQLTGQTSPILVTGTTTFTINIDTTLFDPFAIPGSPNIHVDICGLIVPIGSRNDTLAPAEHNAL